MIISEAPWGRLITLRYDVFYTNQVYNIPCYILGSTFSTHDTANLYLVGFKEKPSMDVLCYETNRQHDSFFEDEGSYRNTKLHCPISEIKKQFSYVKWISGTRECSFIEQWSNQKCVSCKLEAPHHPPNNDGTYICDICTTANSL